MYINLHFELLFFYYLCRFPPFLLGSTLLSLSVWTLLSAICGPQTSSVAFVATHILQILLSCEATYMYRHTHKQSEHV